MGKNMLAAAEFASISVTPAIIETFKIISFDNLSTFKQYTDLKKIPYTQHNDKRKEHL